MTLARVAREMGYEQDEKLLREHVTKDPPLHIRRTLYQYRFPGRADNQTRDKEQVVYRGTRAGRGSQSRLLMVDQLWLWVLDNSPFSQAVTIVPRLIETQTQS